MDLIDRALDEDLGGGDITTNALIPPDVRGRASIASRAAGTIAGLAVAEAVFERIDSQLQWRAVVDDGDLVQADQLVAEVSGDARAILGGERLALNFIQRMSGIATATAHYVAAIPAEKNAVVLDTRKTAPGLRELDKYAVWLGGGRNHRQGLFDGVLIKDNHLKILQARGLSLAQIVNRAREHAPHTCKIEVEVTTVDMARVAADAGADVVMLDNMSLPDIRAAVDAIGGRCAIEASGGVDLENIAVIASSDVQMISVGALTHSVIALDVALEFEPSQ